MEDNITHYRTIWLSDIHLGTYGCKADILLDFLKNNESEKLYLVGDIIDGWQLKRKWYWPQSHSDVVQKILRKARKGTKVIFVPGNHDEFARSFISHHVGGIEIVEEDIHITADDKTLWITHGDLYDGFVQYTKWLAHLGDAAYTFLLKVNNRFNSLRARLGLPYWSLSGYVKMQVKSAASFISDYETGLAKETKKRACDGVVCGHIHHAELKYIDGILYCNDGDWVESCTALVEHFDGRLEIIQWKKS